MASNNLIFAVPSANSSVNYDLPESESAKLSFGPEDIDGLKMDANGGLVISFVEGGNVTLTNFQSFIDNGNTLSLADGTQVDPKLLFNALGGQNDNPFPASDAVKIGIPAENTTREITLEPGKKYVMNFDLSETQGADVKDGKMVINFENGGKIVIANYEAAMANATPPELSLTSKTCVVTGDQLITNIQELAKANSTPEVVVAAEEEQETKPKSKIAAADMEGKEDIGPGNQTDLAYKAAKVEPSAAEDIENQLANIETAAGGPAAGGRGGSNNFGSRINPDPFQGKGDIGPIDPTQLKYRAPILTPSQYLDIDPDSNPIAIGPGAKFIDETNLKDGPISVSGGISIDFGADGNGGITPNGSFSSGGSQTGGVLSSNGSPITVTVVGNTYIGTTADGVKVFDLTIDSVTGDYKFTQYEQLDHADGSNPNDQIVLDFGVTARDGDGDSVSTNVQIVIADDAPEIEGGKGSVDETDFGTTISVSGQLDHNFGQDGAGKITSDGTFTAGGSVKGGALTSAGVPVIVTATANGYEGKANGVTVFTLTIDPKTGDFTYTQFKNLDHADNSNPNDEITLTFGAKIVDYDGDTDVAPIVITVVDDGPDFQSCGCGPKPDKGLEIVDETNLKNGPVVETGKLDADFGADVPGSYSFKDGSFTSSGSKLNGNLTHNGVPVVVTLENGVWVGKAGDTLIFKLELTGSTGDYKFTLYDNFDHADASNPNDEIVLDFGVIAKDYEGDGAEGSIRIIVKDDAPDAKDDGRSTFTGDTITGNVTSNDVVGQDTPGTVTKVVFNNTTYNVPATGTVTINGTYGTLTIDKNGAYSYTAKEKVDGVDKFTYTLKDNDGDTDTAVLSIDVENDNCIPQIIKPADEILDETNLASGTITETGTVTANFFADGPGTFSGNGSFTSSGSRTGNALSHNGTPVVVTYENGVYTGKAGSVTVFTLAIASNGSYTFKLFEQLDHADGNNPNDIINLDFGVTATDADGDTASTTITVKVKDDAPDAKDDGRTTVTGDTITGNVTSNDIVGQDTPGKVTKVTFNGTSYDVPATGQVTVNGAYGTLKIDANGVYSYTAKEKVEGVDKFTYTLKDNDGDTDTAVLSIDVANDNCIPSIIKPADEIVDETNLASGTITETGTVTANFYNDGPGTFTGTGSFVSGGSKLNGNLTHNGTPVVVTYENGVYTGKAGNVTIFTMAITSTGAYTFKLFEQLDHADGNNPNDVIDLTFGVKATDADGDSASTTITVKVKDDAPDAIDDGRTTSDGSTITGNVTSNDVVGQDTPGTVTKVTFNGTSYNVPATGTVTVNGTYGTLKIDATGAYTYTSKSKVDGVDKFTYTLKDNDGDTDTAVLSIDVNNENCIPQIIKPADEIVDETDLANGVITETGTVTANFFEDGPGTFSGNGSFTSSGSRTGNVLSHNGTPVVVTYENGVYTGKAGSVTVFTLTIASNGSYAFKLFEQLDHADGNNPNDIINLNFGVKATDADGDSAATTITVKVKDDAPVANDDTIVSSKGSVVTGNVTNNDVPGQDTPAKVIKIEFNGTVYDVPATGNLTLNAKNGILVINQNGEYTYSLKGDASGVEAFVYTLQDKDGDIDTAMLSICTCHNDDTPTIVKPADEIVDETNLASGVITETGAVSANFYNDGPGTFGANGTFASSGSRTGNVLSHNGTPVTVTLENGVYVGKAGSITVFTMAIAANGSYTFKLFEQLDHADGNNPNDIINLDFGVKATDADGDSVSTTITVKVKDDAPDAIDDGRTTSDGSTITGNVTSNDIVGQDTPGTVTKVTFNGTSYNVPATGTVTVNGTYGTLKIDATGAYTYTSKSKVDGEDKFTYTLKDKDGDTDTAVLSIDVNNDNCIPQIIKPSDEIVDETNLASGTITETGTVTANFFTDGPGTFSGNGSFTSSGSRTGNTLSHNGTPVVVTYENGVYTGKAGSVTVFTMAIASNGSYTFKLFEQLDHADGNNPNDIINLDFGVKATDADGDSASTTITVKVKDDAPIANDDGRVISDGVTVTGNVMSNDVVGQDVAGTITKVVFNGTTYTVPATGTVTINGTYGTLTIDKNGAYSYSSKTNVDGIDNFTYTLMDKDGDTDPAILSICVADGNTVPTIVKPATEVVDETNLKDGIITETGTVSATYGNDGPGSITANGSFTSSGSKLNGNLTHNGTPVVVSLEGNTYVGKAGSVTVFTLAVAANGSYTFKLFEQLDHADGSNPNDIITLDFGVKATDADGDSAATTITVQVKDDAPDAKDDGRTVSDGSTITGNVTDNDIVGQDTPGTVTKVVFNGTTYNVPATGTVTVNGTYGTLKIDKNGAYTYTSKTNVDGVDNFTYTLKDNDGDTDTACLSISIEDGDTTPTIVKPAVEIVDETNLASGVITETGTVTANFFSDGPGTFSGNGSFTSSGSRTGNVLSHNGTPVTVSYENGVYTGKAGSVTVFTMAIAANGSYTFKLFEQLDHADGNNPNDIINLDFGVKATDADGDSAATTITVQVKDDAPVANDDGVVLADGKTVTGNVMSNDVVGQDVAGTITKVVFNGTTYTVPATGSLTINGTYGTLMIDKNGAYSYTSKANVDGIDNFTYTLMDKDGDTDPAILSICVADGDTTPTIIKPVTEVVDETNLKDGVITETGTVTADFHSDGPGTFSGNGSFTSSGSRTGNALSHNGTPVVVTYENGVYTGKAGSVTVFTMAIAANGSYTFKLFEQLDHADGNNPNDIINLDFGVKATDADGDSAATTITVQVKDDAPDAKDDGRTTSDGSTITGNVTSNDIVGQDTPGTVTKVTFNGTSYNVPATGTVTVNGTYGTLKIDATGAYTYTSKSKVDGMDQFTYTLRDKDGDTDTACLSIDVENGNTVPTIVKPATEVVDETNLASGTITESGNVTANFYNDGPGTFAANNNFASSGSRLGNNLTSGGIPVTVTLEGNTYIGKAGSVTVFTMAVAATGSYVFKLFEQLDHADGSNPNDIINLDFGVKATDADGDSAATTITVQVKDDAPALQNDYCTLVNKDTQVSSNVLSNDTIGQDAPGRVTSITFGGVDYTVPATGTKSITSGYGVLTIDANGAYTYKLSGSTLPQGVTEEFTVHVTDADGDKASSLLQVNLVRDYTQGSNGNDTIFGTNQSETIHGNGGDDWLYGQDNWDVLYGDAGNDKLFGGNGDDHLIGGMGNDTLTGGAGADTFWFMAINEGVDRITDFNVAEGDKLELSNVISNFDPVTDAINDFVFASYSNGHTTISVNADGIGGAAGATVVAVLENTNVSVSDLFNNGSIIV